jgi:hypothetical protein
MKFKDTNNAGSKDYLKLKPSEPTRGIFMGDPYEYRIHWVNGKTVNCESPNGCAQCDLGNRSSFQFKINVIVKENEAYMAKIWQQGITVYNALKALHADYNLEKHVMKLTRNGTTKDDTTYSIIPVKDGQINIEMAGKLKDIKLHNFGNTPQQGFSPDVEPFQTPDDSDFIPNEPTEVPF